MDTSLILSDKDLTTQANIIAEHFFNSGLFTDTKSKSQIFVKILAGQEMGLTPFVAMQSIDIVMGKVFIKPYLMASLINKSKEYRYSIKVSTDTECEIEYYEFSQATGKYEKLGTSKYTIEEAKRAGLVKPNSGYEKNPSDMLFARAMARGFRRYTPHLISMPVYVEGEEWLDRESYTQPEQTQEQYQQPKIPKETPKEIITEEPKKIPEENPSAKTENNIQDMQPQKKVKEDNNESVPTITEILDSIQNDSSFELIDTRKQRIFRQTAFMHGWTEDMLKVFFKETSYDDYKFDSIDKIRVDDYQHLLEGIKDKKIYNHILGIINKEVENE